MNNQLENSWFSHLKKLEAQETHLEKKVTEIENEYAGLKDIDSILQLVNTKLSISLLLIERMSSASREEVEKLHKASRNRALKATFQLESLVTSGLDENDRETLKAHPLFKKAKEKMQQIILEGGGIFFEADELDNRKLNLVSRALVSSIRKYALRDDLYPPPEMEKYNPFFRRLMNILFPVLLRENQKPPPYGIEEGEEQYYTSKNIKMPLSQAILFYEKEALPQLKERLSKRPGDASLQQEISRIENLLKSYKKMKFIPRSTPIVMEKGFYTEWFTGYTRDGEMLVNVPIPVKIRSGTNTERLMELVRMDLVKRVAGKGISKELDGHYKYLKSIESGLRGNSRTPSLKIDTRFGYQVLKKNIPFLGILEDKNRFLQIVDTVMNERLEKPENHILHLIKKETSLSDNTTTGDTL